METFALVGHMGTRRSLRTRLGAASIHLVVRGQFSGYSESLGLSASGLQAFGFRTVPSPAASCSPNAL